MLPFQPCYYFSHTGLLTLFRLTSLAQQGGLRPSLDEPRSLCAIAASVGLPTLQDVPSKAHHIDNQAEGPIKQVPGDIPHCNPTATCRGRALSVSKCYVQSEGHEHNGSCAGRPGRGQTPKSISTDFRHVKDANCDGRHGRSCLRHRDLHSERDISSGRPVVEDGMID